MERLLREHASAEAGTNAPAHGVSDSERRTLVADLLERHVQRLGAEPPRPSADAPASVGGARTQAPCALLSPPSSTASSLTGQTPARHQGDRRGFHSQGRTPASVPGDRATSPCVSTPSEQQHSPKALQRTDAPGGDSDSSQARPQKGATRVLGGFLDRSSSRESSCGQQERSASPASTATHSVHYASELVGPAHPRRSAGHSGAPQRRGGSFTGLAPTQRASAQGYRPSHRSAALAATAKLEMPAPDRRAPLQSASCERRSSGAAAREALVNRIRDRRVCCFKLKYIYSLQGLYI